MSADLFRSLCAELTEKLHKYTSLYKGYESELVTRARAALAQAEPAPPTDEEIIALAVQSLDLDEDQEEGTISFARAVWRLAHWGTPVNTINQED